MYPPNYWKKQESQWFGSKYLLQQFLGCGAFGAVFRADEMLAERVMQSVAVKIVIADLDNLDKQLAELQLAVKFRHPHLINGITCEQGDIFGDLCLGLVMELAEESLDEYCAKRPEGLPVETALKITEHLAKGLAALHQDKIIHRDLKPANVLIVKDLWKLADFGIARSLQDKTSTYTRASQQIGTGAYMPPEAYSGKISPAWDLWSLGIMIHQLLSGQHPFPTELAPELMRMVLMEEPQIAPAVTSPLKEIVTGCLIKDPQRRWSAEQVLDALKPPAPVIQISSPPGPVQSAPVKQNIVTPKPQVKLNSPILISPPPVKAQSADKGIPQPTIPSPEPLIKIIEDLGGGVSLELIQLPAGQFMMGSPDSDPEAKDNEKPQHLVTIKAVAIGKYPITQGQYKAIMGVNLSKFKGNPNNPVEGVSWNKAQEFCKILSQKTGKKYRLPSEAEWEYACRAGTTTRYYFGENVNQFENYSWFIGNSNRQTHPVGEKKPNPWGLYDMYGNVWEWCEDNWHKDYQGAPIDGSAWINSYSQYRITRGGSWGSYPKFCRSACRYYLTPGPRDNSLGFRVLCEGSRLF